MRKNLGEDTNKRQKIETRVRIKCIAITKCDQFFNYRNAKEISFYYFRDTKLCIKYELVFLP